jgi:serine/threonine-protein kinase
VLAALPGGDPLAAALAAGETPSPDMVASARERGGLAPRWAVSLLAVVVITLGLGGVLLPKWTIAPEKGPDELGALAREMLRDLGHELPPVQASDFIQNTTYMRLLRQDVSRGWVNDGQAWPPPYFYWHRANPVSLISDDIHAPATQLAEPLAAPPGSVVIVLGSGGRLVELEVVPEPGLEEPDTRTEGMDWSLVLEQAGLDRVDLEPTAPARAVPAYCDKVTAFHVERSEKAGGDFVFQSCAHRGRVVHAATVWEWDPMGPLGGARQKHFFQRSFGNPFKTILTAVHILSALLAWYNVRLGRGDRRGAILYGAVVFVAYLLFNASHARISESGIISFLGYVVAGNPLGHAAMHAIHTTLLYLAIEPYVRRVWPRALIGWARLARGRWRDPAVAREVLIGMAALLLGSLLGSVGRGAVRTLANLPMVSLYLNPKSLGDSAEIMAQLPHYVALSMYDSMLICFLVLVARLLTRRDWATIAVPLLGLGSLTVVFFLKDGPIALVAGIPLVVLCASLLLVVVRVGLLATMVFMFVGRLFFLVPMTFDMSKFYAPQALFGVLLLIAIAFYGFRYSLAGQPVLRNVLGRAAEAGGGSKIR